MTKKNWTESDVKLHLATIRMAIDKDSPFRGMIDLTELFKLPIDLQKAIHAGLTEDEKKQVQELYGEQP